MSFLGYLTLLMSLKLFLCRIKFKEDILISSPDVSLVELGPDVEFLILATDGLWDYMKRSIQVSLFLCSLPKFQNIVIYYSNFDVLTCKLTVFCSSEAVAFVRDQLRQHGDVQVFSLSMLKTQ